MPYVITQGYLSPPAIIDQGYTPGIPSAVPTGDSPTHALLGDSLVTCPLAASVVAVSLDESGKVVVLVPSRVTIELG